MFAAMGEHSQKKQRRRQPRRIRTLIAEDSAVVRDMIATYLEKQGRFEIVGLAADGREAVELAAKLEPDLVLTDMNMPRMNGLDATRRIKKAPRPPRVIVVTFADASAMR